MKVKKKKKKKNDFVGVSQYQSQRMIVDVNKTLVNARYRTRMRSSLAVSSLSALFAVS